jgi:hypothetical protein
VVPVSPSIETPDVETLTEGLRALFAQHLVVISRNENLNWSTFPSEIVTFRATAGQEQKIFLKYGPSSRHSSDFSLRAGVSYEAAIYRAILGKVNIRTAKFLGEYSDRNDTHWLALEYLPDTMYVNLAGEEALVESARVIGQFHNECDVLDLCQTFPLITYDKQFYYSLSQRFLDRIQREEIFTSKRNALGKSIQAFMELIPALVKATTLVHGEYYPRNILVSNKGIFPIDWEGAAIAPGEIDLAHLTQGWGEEVSRRCIDAYAHVRWPSRVPAEFERRLEAARFYLCLRWLSEDWAWSMPSMISWIRELYAQLELSAARLELI